jgi:ComF family protein
VLSGLRRFPAWCLNNLFPDECRVCEQPLTNLSRIPVCPACLTLPQPLTTEHFCARCRTPFVDSYPLDEYDLCTVCRKGSMNFDAVYSFGSYDGPLRKLIHAFKYGRVESLAKPLGKLLIRTLPAGEEFDLVMAMPMHWLKRIDRGFNQADLLARPVAKRYGLKLATNLKRSRRTAPQASLDEVERQKNLKDSFAVRRAKQMVGRRILLVDDVFTTGATLRAATETLKAAGAKRVYALTLARVDAPVRANGLSRLNAALENGRHREKDLQASANRTAADAGLVAKED